MRDAIYAAFGCGYDGLDTADDPEALTGEAIRLARVIAVTEDAAVRAFLEDRLSGLAGT